MIMTFLFPFFKQKLFHLPMFAYYQFQTIFNYNILPLLYNVGLINSNKCNEMLLFTSISGSWEKNKNYFFTTACNYYYFSLIIVNLLIFTICTEFRTRDYESYNRTVADFFFFCLHRVILLYTSSYSYQQNISDM